MPHQIDMIMDFQYGSTGKGLIAGWLAKREKYDTAVCAFATNAGHTYTDAERRLHVMTQQLPTSITSPTVKNILIGPGAAIHVDTLLDEMILYGELLKDKNILIHPQAAIVEDYHAEFEKSDGRTKMGSTAKGVGEAYIERMRRNPETNNTAKNRLKESVLIDLICTEREYRDVLNKSEAVIVEGAQGFSLSMYHGQYPYVTSRDVTPWQIAADCGLPYSWASYIKVIGTLRTFPIRVSNRDGSSGPCYPDQREIAWQDIGREPELTTVTKLPRRIFTFSQQQLDEALFHCGGYWDTRLFLNFANYLDIGDVEDLIHSIEKPHVLSKNPPKVVWVGYGPDDDDVDVLVAER
ncbi:adenylosuccinate synthetase [uncultured Caudovirales phage]|uniref:N6-succino-2-amino-2'-deoxyadenylate synthase n=1 Tax=uncultured Caudovirales phage TaxID=2100421 RepID=A0A6J5KH25_9CAUD|nr:adenylosuccinate synthetase [uncultured Caudovirales phage]